MSLSSETNGIAQAALSGNSQADSSTENSVTTDSLPVNEGANAGSPTADEGVKAVSPLEAVKNALKTQGEQSESGDETKRESPSREAGSKDSESESDADEVSDEEISKHLSEKANKRFRQLVAERDSSKAQVDAYRQSAEAFQTVVQKIQATGASSAQVDQAVELLHAINNNPARAFQMLQPLYSSLQEFVGSKLPSDLQERVDSGFLDESSAAELARLRNSQNFNERKTRAQAEVERQQFVERNASQLKEAVGTASSSWEADWKRSDPDYERKMPFVMSEIKAVIAERGGISSPQEAIEIANTCLRSVNDRLGALVPQRREVRTVTGGFSSGKEAPQPRNALEAATLALRRS